MVMIQSIDLDPRSVKPIDCRANLNECQPLVATTGFMMTSSIGMEKFTMRDTEVGVMDDREFEKKR